MYDNILVPVDFDHDEALGTAMAVAEKLRAEDGRITLLHVIADIPNYAATGIPEDLLKAGQIKSEKHLQTLSDSYPDYCTAKLAHGNASRGILSAIEAEGIDCVIIQSHKPGLQDYFLGSTAARVVRHAPVPVHVLR